MPIQRRTVRGRFLILPFLFIACSAGAADYPAPQEGDFILKDFRFASGETLPELRMHYRTLGKARRDAKGIVRNAVIIGHGTGGSGAQFIRPEFAGELFGAGQPLDATKYFIVLPDGIGHGQSSKPSDGLRAKFPRYGYRDMVDAQYRLLKEGLGVNHLRLVMGTSMGGMQSWVWGERYPDFMDALMPLASLPTQISGRNRVWRRAVIDAIRNDPAWQNGQYTEQPPSLRTAQEIIYFVGSNPQLRQGQMPTLAKADEVLDAAMATAVKNTDANDVLYQVSASWDYDPAPELEKIRAPLLAVNSADDLINPPELGILEREIKRVKQGRAIVLPLAPETRGHGSHTVAALWKHYLVELLETSSRDSARHSVPLSSDWRFHLGDAPDSVRDAAIDDSTWERVSVPHNWNRMGGTTEREREYQNVYGPGWYRLKFNAPTQAAQKRVYLQFDAASIITDVWLNGTHLGQHKGAFARFRFDATSALKAIGENLLVVRVDNSKAQAPGSAAAEVIPISGDWPMYGGLYRRVSLVLTEPAHIDMLDFGGPGVYAHTEKADANSASIQITTRLKNDSGRNTKLRVVSTIVDSDGQPAGSASSSVSLAPGSGKEATQTVKVSKPRLWNGTADPHLYSVRVELRDAKGSVLDDVTQPLGIRTIRIDPNTGLSLNGKPLRLHGVSRHQDLYAKGWAIDRDDIRRDMAMIKEIGANTVRFAHYQHDSYAYQLADEMGFIAWAEIPLVDRTSPPGQENTTAALAANAEQQLRELIRQNYNHPSIAVWSIGNEVNLEAAKGRTVSNAAPLLNQLHKLSKAEDPVRPTTLADCCGSVPGEARKGLDTVAGLTDVIGFNRYYGWYSGDVSVLTGELTRLHQMYPNQPISVSEYGAGGALTQHTDNPRGGPIHAFGRPHPEGFQSYILEESWKQIDALPFVWASWVWNMFDFSNDARLEGDLIDTNDKGLVTFDRKTRKDAFYFFKANWSTEPVLHIAGRRHVERAYGIVDIRAYSNAPEARLQVGSKDWGAAKCESGICLWRDVALERGDNVLLAKAVIGGEPVTDTVLLKLSVDPSELRIRAGTLVGALTSSGVRYGSDHFFTGGTARDRDPPAASRGAKPAPATPVAVAQDQAPYESYREGQFSYAIPSGSGNRVVTLRFFEPLKDQAAGARVFDVLIEGRPVLESFDVIRAAGGALRAVEKQFNVPVDGTLNLEFRPRVGAAIVSAIEVTR